LHRRSYVGRYFVLHLDGYDAVGLLRGVEGGGINGPVIASSVAGSPEIVKHIGNPFIEPITIQVGLAMSSPFYDWIASSWMGRAERRNGSIIIADADLRAREEYQFRDALIIETTMPSLDRSTRESAFMTVKIQPESADYRLLDGTFGITAVSNPEQQLWQLSNFRFELGGVHRTSIWKIESFSIKQHVAALSCGPDWMYQIEPTRLEIPNLTVFAAANSAGELLGWHRDFLQNGNNAPERERTAAIVMLSPNRALELLHVDLHGVGIAGVAMDKADATADSLRRVKADLYVTRMGFRYHRRGSG
jgi:hypothetical protein